jgi:hypothetical protein
MEDAMLENGKTFAEYFLEIGQALDINPVYLAVKARQEQGVLGNGDSGGSAAGNAGGGAVWL